MRPILYNEIEPYAARWLRHLSGRRHIAAGDVDSRSIRDLRAEDLVGRTQVHFFAGIGVWSYALRLAGIADDTPVWTGSCPCQPFSSAGKGGGFGDERHLWPAWFSLIRECRPPIIFGEQVASPAGLGWLDLVSSDLEGSSYTVGAAIVPVAGVGGPHARHRGFFVAFANRERLDGVDPHLRSGKSREAHPEAARDGAAGGRANGDEPRSSDGGLQRGRRLGRIAPDPLAGFWANSEWIYCRDRKLRPVEPGTFPLAHGAPARVGRLRAYGNAICPEVAAVFIRAAMAAQSEVMR